MMQWSVPQLQRGFSTMEMMESVKGIYNLQQVILPLILLCVVIILIMCFLIYSKLTEEPETNLDKMKKAIKKVRAVKKENK